MFIILKILSYPLLLVFLAINGYCLYKLGFDIYVNYLVYTWIGAGIFGYLLVLAPIFRKNLEFLETFTHELIHTVVGLLFLQRIHSFTATDGGGGAIEHSGRHNRNVFITLSPYFLPIYTIFFILIKLMIIESSIYIFDIIIGLTFGFHLLAMMKDIRPYQTDLQKFGYFFSYLFVIAFLIFMTCIVLWSIKDGLGGAFANWWNVALESYTWVRGFI